MKSLFSMLRNTVTTVILGATLQGCGCDTWGCVDGLRVMFDSIPPAPWKLELLVNGVVQKAPEDAICDSAEKCRGQGGVQFNILPRDNVSARITTSAGVRTTNFPRITYEGKSPRFDCHDCKGQAAVIGLIPQAQ